MSDPHDVLRNDPAMAPLVVEHGELSIEPAADSIERLVASVVRQQLSTASADAIEGRLFDRFDVTPAVVPIDRVAVPLASRRLILDGTVIESPL